ncbi:MAG: Trypsin-like peptidase domain/Colicin production protein [Actinomycetia bacterium]|nr:Trypsin-like peptidase domain/Colicin production protein [Actinomycetes bacterium]
MNGLDALIGLLIVAAATVGYRLGFITRLVSWIGLVAGAGLAVRLLPGFVGSNHTSITPRTQVFAAVGLVVGLGLVGQAIGMVVAHRTLGRPTTLVQTADRLAGAVLGGFGVLVIVWMIVPAMLATAGWPSQSIRSSSIVRAVDEIGPDQPASLRELGRQIAESNFSQILDPAARATDPGPVPASGLGAALDARIQPSVVKVEGQACDTIQDGSGFVVKAGLVVTNAHVVAGETDTRVIRKNGDSYDAKVVGFDPDRDLAILRVPSLHAAPIPLAAPVVGDSGAVYGFPGGAGLRPAPARVASQVVAVGRDIYDTSETRRDVLILAAGLAPGDSGAALVNAAGNAIGVAFAIDPAHPTTGYALTSGEIRSVLDFVGTASVSTGACTHG